MYVFSRHFCNFIFLYRWIKFHCVPHFFIHSSALTLISQCQVQFYQTQKAVKMDVQECLWWSPKSLDVCPGMVYLGHVIVPFSSFGEVTLMTSIIAELIILEKWRSIPFLMTSIFPDKNHICFSVPDMRQGILPESEKLNVSECYAISGLSLEFH